MYIPIFLPRFLYLSSNSLLFAKCREERRRVCLGGGAKTPHDFSRRYFAHFKGARGPATTSQDFYHFRDLKMYPFAQVPASEKASKSSFDYEQRIRLRGQFPEVDPSKRGLMFILQMDTVAPQVCLNAGGVASSHGEGRGGYEPVRS